MALFPQQFIDDVRAAADIVTIVSESVSLRKAGTGYKGLCPFHGEKTPSFQVNRDRGIFKCFGCGVGGDVFKFVELTEKVAFPDAVRQLAQRVGIPVPESEGTETSRENAAEREALLMIHETAAAFFREQLDSPAGLRVGAYLEKERALTPATIDALGLGYAPQSRDALRQRLLARGFSPGMLVRSGLVARRDDGSEVDRFRNRLMVPIARDGGSVIAFGGRALAADQMPKYLNSPETPIYAKSRTLYGLHLTKADVRKAGFAIIVEGYFDFAQVYQAGGLPVIASCGTALTPHQAQTLRRLAPKVVLNYDADSAGQGAAARSSELLVAEGFVVNVAVLPPGEDPDSFLQRHGRDAYLGRLRESRPYLDFLLDRAASGHDLSSEESRREFLRSMLAVAARIPDAAERDRFADRLAHKARVTESVIRAEIRKAAVARRTTLPAERLPSLSRRLLPAERGLLWALVHTPDAALAALDLLKDADCEELRSFEVLRVAKSLSGISPAEMPSSLLERLSTTEAQLVTAAASEPEAPVLTPHECVRTLQLACLERKRAEIQDEIDRIRREDTSSPAMAELLRRKLDLATAVEHASRPVARKV
ncbi:MAG: DNA primase [Acidobacteria bacterium]|nr:DNA primase [Acidobacteriota bacterium]